MMNSKVNNVPKLRFKEFSGEWKSTYLSSIIKLMQSGISRQLKNEDVGYPILRSNNLVDGKISVKDIKYWFKIDDQGTDLKKYILNDGDLLINFINSIAQIGKSAIFINELERDTIFTTNLMRLTFKENVCPFFIFSLFNTKKYFDYIQSITKPAVNQASFTTKDLSNFVFLFPSLKEQQKIADFLSSVDSKLQALKQKQQLLQQYKKGMVQKLFSQQIRFKDENEQDYPEWKNFSFSQIFSRVLRKNKENNQNVLTISAQFGLINQQKFFTKNIAAKDTSNYYLLKKDEFAYNKSYSQGYPMGAIKKLNNYDKGVVSTLYICFKAVNDQNNNFWEQFFESGMMNKELSKIAQEGARNHGLLNISVGDFFDKIILETPSIPEQQKIANFLSAIDKKIDGVTKQIEQTALFKKGLLQQLFV